MKLLRSWNDGPIDRSRVLGNEAHHHPPGRGRRAFSLVEVSAAMALVGITLIAMLGSLNWVVSCVQWTREGARATQLMEEKLDTLRLYSWDQLNTPGFISTNFVATFSTLENGAAMAYGSGLIYTGTVTIGSSPLTEAYGSQVKLVTVSLRWNSGHRPRLAQMSTFVAQYGMQSFVY
jgi:prepilin-type N-terminal cleavage/methylation domain-containing protein